MITKEGKYYCIKTLKDRDTVMLEGETYIAKKYNDGPIRTYFRIYDDSGNSMTAFHTESLYNKETIPNHFVSLQKLRKLKLEKLKSCSNQKTLTQAINYTVSKH